ncbi:MAG TPA: hypothetical protein VFD00_10990 [Thermoclostridium sp.]|nr:hypothetical protein [Thermoclostridium sp.]
MNNIDTAIEYLKNNSHKMIEKGNNYAVQSVKMAIYALELQLSTQGDELSDRGGIRCREKLNSEDKE